MKSDNTPPLPCEWPNCTQPQVYGTGCPHHATGAAVIGIVLGFTATCGFGALAYFTWRYSPALSALILGFACAAGIAFCGGVNLFLKIKLRKP